MRIMVSYPACLHQKSHLVREGVGLILIFSRFRPGEKPIKPPISIRSRYRYSPHPAALASRQIFANVVNILLRKLILFRHKRFREFDLLRHGNDPKAKRRRSDCFYLGF